MKKKETSAKHRKRSIAAVERRKKNIDNLSNSSYNFLFAENSDIFHVYGCPLVLNAKKISGSIFYQTAAKGRRPCKYCRPRAKDENKFARLNKDYTGNRIVKFFGNKTGELESNPTILGECRYYLHPGYLNKNIVKTHKCIEKQCPYFSGYSENKSLTALKASYYQKEKKKSIKRKKAKTATTKESRLNEYKETMQSICDETGYEMLIVRVEVNKKLFKIFYVSGNPFADGNRFPLLLSGIKEAYPGMYIALKHIKNVDGSFATISDYKNRIK